MKFNEKIQKLRKENNLSQEALADKLGISRQAVSKWESGTTYPEMDKMVELCKIFNCSLDDLTNETKEVKQSNNKKNIFMNIADWVMDFINRSVKMFETMNKDQRTKCIIWLVALLIIILLLRIPFEHIYILSSRIFNNFDLKSASILSSLIYFVLNITYLVVAIGLFIYIYKVKFLDSYQVEKEIKLPKEEPKEELKEELKEEKLEPTIEKEEIVYKKHRNPILSALAVIFTIFIKFFLAIMAIPFATTLFVFYIIMAISIGLIFEGIFSIGLILTLTGAIIFTTLIVEMIIRYIFNSKLRASRIVGAIVTSIVFSGIGFGLVTLQATKINYIDEIPGDYERKTITEEYLVQDVSFINNDYYNIDYVIEDDQTDKIRMEINYYPDWVEVNPVLTNNNGLIIETNGIEHDFDNEIVKIIKDNLKQKEVYNYSKLYIPTITIYTSEENIKKLRANYFTYIEDQEREECDNTIDILENKIEQLEDEKEDLINEYERKIEDYRDRVTGALN